MKKVESKSTSGTRRRTRPALTPEADENQMICLATDFARKAMEEGTASSQIVVHYLKLGTAAKKLELEKLKNENMLLQAKTEAIQSGKRTEELINDALAAMKRYSGHGGDDVYVYDD